VKAREAIAATSAPEHEASPVQASNHLDFAAFFDREHARLYRALILVTRNTHDADEVAQEAFARVWERWERVGKMVDPVGYLYRTAMSRYFQALRRSALALRHRTIAAPSEDVLDHVELAAVVERLLLQLPARQRAALVVTELLGYDSIEAGRILGIRAGTVRRLASQAKSRLREGGWSSE
jgi:RNA polymerase sigma factor (sigma-70 family)